MLDMKMVRENPDNIRKMLKDRTVEFDLDSLLDLDKKRSELSLASTNNSNIPEDLVISL